MKKTSYKTNSWWNHRMVNGMNPDRNIEIKNRIEYYRNWRVRAATEL